MSVIKFPLIYSEHDMLWTMFKVNNLWPLKKELCPTPNPAHFFLEMLTPNQLITVEKKLYWIISQMKPTLGIL